ncbi:ATP-dependent metallopeptidase FtsH/Yme1/Tma family protein [Borrelia miyamotoi]|uniref:ATP-dependent zinc metalloprotease FtsH n=1 Tax=Borrelia miyamotoi TaxID=47466 RepID=A0AAX3JKL8_9SPIR|nr:ATP-dependent zinc metalloprotease FtsH [Borrelia miyamotoi]QFP41594.1 ATP-dependent metallopeptidase FtsH/Yme1/Tma family protein [Borrelia miyamotoi]QFP47714.1 ATP-dependent zinc metalloprotease FtsH [Borrelia miyamotoi]QGT55476.1 ATP-dependent zinc metalloprotease FtsH [Borrelia miyamotoi]QGT56257.1 ATP-dependent zinc metalloprotease FtsH [Borrelia miyamotoi]WAZ71501.1 ATP-dependent zinc metalloprotease FtsH [Borrelia miyamotoi]
MSINNNNLNNNCKSNNKKKNKNWILILVIIFLVLAIFMSYFMRAGNSYKSVPYSTFQTYLDSGLIESVIIIDKSQIQFVVKNSNLEKSYFFTNIPYFDISLLAELKAKKVEISSGKSQSSLIGVIFQTLPWILFFIFFFFIFRQTQGGGGKVFSFGKSNAQKYEAGKNKVTFKDVAGQEEVKQELNEVVEFLKYPKKFEKIGARIPKGVLLVGSPGTGKTLLAKAVAGEAGVNFFHMSGSDFVEMFVGVGASRVRDLFDNARKNAPCIIFIDELDAVGRSRGAGLGGGHDEREQTLNQLLVEMDGFGTYTNVIVMAATNRPDVLDSALLRPGRFDRQVTVTLPDIKEREAILNIHAKKTKFSKRIDLQVIARATPGVSGADLANLINEGALIAARNNQSEILMSDLEEARDKILMGVAKKSMMITDRQKLETAYHEAGHALLHYYLEYADPLHKVSIIPRGRALGVAFSLPREDRLSINKNQILDKIKICYGGYASEQINLGFTTAGVQNDLMQATNLAKKMVTEWGMGEDVGPIFLVDDEAPIFLPKEFSKSKAYSENTADRVDREVKKILEGCLKEASDILIKHKEQLVKLAEALIARETLTDNEIRKLLGFKIIENDYEKSLEESKMEIENV